MVQRRAARFCLNDYTPREAGCVSEMLKQLHLQQLITIRTNRRLTILHKAFYGHIALPVNNLLQPLQRLSRHLNNKAFNTIHASKNCYKYPYFPPTIRDWNSLSDALLLTFLNHYILNKLKYMTNNPTACAPNPDHLTTLGVLASISTGQDNIYLRIGYVTYLQKVTISSNTSYVLRITPREHQKHMEHFVICLLYTRRVRDV